jgi:succinoglycan biosynthesis transport protein ExoP
VESHRAPYPEAGSVPAVRTEFTLRDAVTVLRRRRNIVLYCCLFFLLLASIKCIFGTRRYQAEAAIQIQKEESDSLGIESALGSAEAGASDALDYNITLQTQARVLTSDSLALAVIRGVNLEQNDDFTGRHAWFRFPALLPSWDKTAVLETAATPLENAPERRRRALKTFAKRLKVQIEPGTRIINISFLSTEPKTAADVVNQLVSEFTEYNYKTRFAATAQVSDWLNGQLQGIASQARDSQEKLVQLQRGTGLFGDDEQHNVVLARLDELNSALVSAEETRILAEALDKVTATGNPEAIGTINAGGNAAFSSNTAASLALVQQFRSRQADLNAELHQTLAKFGPNYPLAIEQQAQLQSVERSLQDEVTRIAQRAHSEFQMAVFNENASRASLDQQKAVVEKLNSRAMEYVVAKQDADSTRDLLEDLKKKLADAKLLSGLRSSNVTIVDPGRPPSLKHPIQPNVPMTLAAGCLIGLFAGCVLAFTTDSRDTRIHSSSQLEALLGTPPLAILPSFEHVNGWSKGLPQLTARTRKDSASEPPQPLASLDPDSSYAEALRSLRTSLMLSRSQRHPKVILITSAQPGEGKSTTALHLSTILGQLGGRVLIVDGDLRRPTLHEKLNIANEHGLSSLLSEAGALADLHSLGGNALGGNGDVWVLTAGPRPPYPAELLGSARMETLLGDWRANFDFILIDTPPVLPVTDAVLLSSSADIVLLVARHRVSTTHAVYAAHRRLTTHGSPNKVAVILNGVERKSADLADYYGYGYKYGLRPEAGGAHAS